MVKYGLDYFLDHFLDHVLDHFLDHFKGEEHFISTEGGVGWDEVYQFWGRGGRQCSYPGRGERRTNTTQGGVGGGCNNKHYWFMELLLDRTSYFNWFFDWIFVCLNFSAGPRRFFIFLSCKSETATERLDVYDPPPLSYACAFWVNLCTISCSLLSPAILWPLLIL